MTTRLVVGIAGGSGSGKTTLARRVQERLPPGTAARVSHDAYYRDLAHLPLAERAAFNFDHPDALESELLAAHLTRLRNGHPVEVPMYDFSTHTRCSTGRPLDPAPVVLVDGVLVLAVERLREELDLMVFVETDPLERLRRRVRRDVRDRGRTPTSVRQQWDATVHPMYERYVAPSRAHAHVLVHHGAFAPGTVNAIANRIVSALGGAHP